jgi:hypothetical protein
LGVSTVTLAGRRLHRAAATAGDSAVAVAFAAVVSDRGNTDESGDAPPGEDAEFGQVSDQGAGDRCADRWSGVSRSSFSRQAGVARIAVSMSVSTAESCSCNSQ